MSISNISLPPGYELEVNLPEGYELEDNSSPNEVKLPPGYVLEKPARSSPASSVGSAAGSAAGSSFAGPVAPVASTSVAQPAVSPRQAQVRPPRPAPATSAQANSSATTSAEPYFNPSLQRVAQPSDSLLGNPHVYPQTPEERRRQHIINAIAGREHDPVWNPSQEDVLQGMQQFSPEYQAAKTSGRKPSSPLGTYNPATGEYTLSTLPIDESLRGWEHISPEVPSTRHGSVVEYVPDASGRLRNIPGDSESTLTSHQANVREQSRRLAEAHERLTDVTLPNAAERGLRAMGVDNPTAIGIARGTTKFVAGVALDPTTYALMGTGGLLSKGGARLMSAGFAIYMGKGAVQGARQLHDVWDRPDVSYQQKVELTTNLILNTGMAVLTAKHTISPEPLPLDERLLRQIESYGKQAKADILARAEQKKLEMQSAAQPSEAAQPMAPGAQNSREISSKSQPVTEPNPTREAAALLKRYEDRVHPELSVKSQPQAPAKPPGPAHLYPADIGQFAANLANLPEAQRADAMVQAHQQMTAWMMDRIGKSWMGPDHKLHVVHSPEEAEKLALEFINDRVDLHDKRLAQNIPSVARNPYPSDLANLTTPTQDFQPAQQPIRPKTPELVQEQKEATVQASPAGSPEEPARIDPNFRLDGFHANMMHYRVLKGPGEIPSLIILNHSAYQVVARAYGSPVDGINIPLDKAQEIIANLGEQAATEPSPLVRSKLRSLTKTLQRNMSQKYGFSFVRDRGRSEAEFRAVQEELFHAVVQRGPGKGSIVAGTPHEAFVADPDLKKMEPRLAAEGVTDHVSRVAEAAHDIWANEAVELSPDEQSRAMEKYWDEAARKNGDAMLRDVLEYWQYLQDLARNQYNNVKGAMNVRAYEALQRVITRRERTPVEAIQGTDQPTHQRVLLQHRRPENTQGDYRKGEEPEGQSGSGSEPEELKRLPILGQSILLPNGQATIEYVSPAMNVAVVRLPDGRLRTIKISDLRAQASPVSPNAPMRNVAPMGRNMTTDSPAVRKVQAESEPVRGQVPEVKVKQEPPQVKSELTQPPAPVRAEDASRIGQPDPESGRAILQPSNDVIQNERLANQAAPDLTTRLSRIAASVEGAKLDRLRPQKGLERLQEKVASGKPPRTIGDNLAAQIVANTVEAKNQLIERLQQEFPVISVDDQFTQLGRKAGYPSANIQVQMPNGGTAEVQIVTPEVQAVTDQTHALYTAGRKFPEGSADRAWYWNEAAKMHAAALERFKARNGITAPPQLSVGQPVVLANGERGTLVSVEPRPNRVVVNTRTGWKTVRPGDITAQDPQGSGILPAAARTRDPNKPRPSVTGKEKLEYNSGLLEDAVTMGKASIISEPGTPPAVLLNRAIAGWLGTQVPDLHLLGGGSIDALDASRLVKDLRVRADGVRLYRKGDPSGLYKIADLIEKATHNVGGLAFVLEGLEPERQATILREEWAHVIQRKLGRGQIERHVPAEGLARRPEARKGALDLATIGYRELNDAKLVHELSAKLASGHTDGLNLSDREQDRFLDAYFFEILKHHGIAGLEEFRPIACDRAKASIKRVVARYGGAR